MTDDAIEHVVKAEAPEEATTDVTSATGGTATSAADATPDRAASDDPLEAMRRVDPAGAERLRQDWGADFDANLQRARSAAAAVADQALVAVLEETGLGNDPRILRAAARIGALLEQQQPVHAKPARAERETLERELDRLVGGRDYWSERVQRRVRQIFVTLHGEAPLPVHRAAGGGR